MLETCAVNPCTCIRGPKLPGNQCSVVFRPSATVSLMESRVVDDPPPTPPHVTDGWGARPLRWLSVLVGFCAKMVFVVRVEGGHTWRRWHCCFHSKLMEKTFCAFWKQISLKWTCPSVFCAVFCLCIVTLCLLQSRQISHKDLRSKTPNSQHFHPKNLLVNF